MAMNVEKTMEDLNVLIELMKPLSLEERLEIKGILVGIQIAKDIKEKTT